MNGMIKRILLFLMILCLTGGAVTAPADDAKTVYTSDFTKDADGWYGRGAQSFITADGTLKTTGRTSSWNSPGRDFNLIEGGEYVLSAEVKQDTLASANFMISVAHTAEGVETYENLAFCSAKKGEWSTLTGTYTAGAFSRFVLYVETTGADTLPLLVDMVCRGREEDDLCNMAAEQLIARGGAIGELLDRYDSATEHGQTLILEICANFPGDDRIFDHMMDKLRNRPDQRALYASFLGKLGDPRAIDTLKSFLTLSDIGYLDYIELRNAVEELGGDPGEDRAFYGDPDYEAMRNM